MSDATPLPQRRNRWLTAGLLASLALNAFLVGAVATDFLSLQTERHKPVSFELRWLEGRLPPEELAKVAAAVDAARPNAEAYIQRLRALRGELGVLAAAPEPDRMAIDAKLAEIRAELNAMVAGSQATAIDALIALPPETRAGLAEPKPGP